MDPSHKNVTEHLYAEELGLRREAPWLLVLVLPFASRATWDRRLKASSPHLLLWELALMSPNAEALEGPVSCSMEAEEAGDPHAARPSVEQCRVLSLGGSPCWTHRLSSECGSANSIHRTRCRPQRAGAGLSGRTKGSLLCTGLSFQAAS